MEKVSFDIVLNLKNNISGALANVRKMFDGVDKSAKSVCSTTARFGSLCSKLKMPDVNALLGVTERLSLKEVCPSDSLWLTLVLLPVFLVMTLKH